MIQLPDKIKPITSCPECHHNDTFHREKHLTRLSVQPGLYNECFFVVFFLLALTFNPQAHRGMCCISRCCRLLEFVIFQQLIMLHFNKQFLTPSLSLPVLSFQSWTGPEKLLALDELIDSCEPTQVKHMMQVIEPQFQRDFISLLPKEVGAALPVITSAASRANTLTADPELSR